MEQKSLLDRLISEKVFYKSVIALIIGMPVIEFITEIICRFDSTFTPSEFQPLVLSLFGITGTVLTALYWISAARNRRKLRIADIFYFTLIFFMAASAIFSKNPGEYSNGNTLMCELPTHYLAYYWLYFAGTIIDDLKHRKNILICFLSVAVLEGIFAFLQTFNIELSYSYLYRADRAAYGLTQNSNYYGGLSVLFIAGIAGMFIFAESVAKSKVFKCGLLVAASFLFYTMIGSRARLAWVGFTALFLFYVISLLIMSKKNKGTFRPAVKRFLILMGAFAIVFCIAFFFTDFIREATVRSYWEVANGDVNRMGSDRIYNWKMGLASVPEHWLTGVGLDNYQYVFSSQPGFNTDMYLRDKAHNEYLHLLVTQGIPALINYLLLLIYACTGAVKKVINDTSKEDQAITWILLGMFITYAAQAFFNSNVTYVVMHFWLIIGLLIPRTPFALLKANKK